MLKEVTEQDDSCPTIQTQLHEIINLYKLGVKSEQFYNDVDKSFAMSTIMPGGINETITKI